VLKFGVLGGAVKCQAARQDTLTANPCSQEMPGRRWLFFLAGDETAGVLLLWHWFKITFLRRQNRSPPVPAPGLQSASPSCHTWCLHASDNENTESAYTRSTPLRKPRFCFMLDR